jgi:hypothetical protein
MVRYSLHYSSSNLTVTPWVHGLPLYDSALGVEYFLSLDDLRAIYVAIQEHPEKDTIIR